MLSDRVTGKLPSFELLHQNEEKESVDPALHSCFYNRYRILSDCRTSCLQSSEQPGSWVILGISAVCSMSDFLLRLLQVMSMFVVMILSLSRTIVIVFPFYKINKTAIFKSIFVYFIFHFICMTCYITLPGGSIYDKASALCFVFGTSSVF